MQTYLHQIAGDTVSVNVPGTVEDLDLFKRWIVEADPNRPVAVDTETTGLDIFSPGYRLRTAQFGDAYMAWVIHWERGGWFSEVARWALRHLKRILIHNAPFDWLVLDRHADISLESLAGRTTDTRLLASLVDPRQPQEGGIGTGLKPLSAYYVDPASPDTQGDLTAVFRSIGLTKSTGWAGIDLTHPTYNLYAGLDVILTARVEQKLRVQLDRFGVRPALVEYEHELARICATMQRTGMVLDEDYTVGLGNALLDEGTKYGAIAARYGVDSIGSPAQVGEALIGMGEVLTERTNTGAYKVDKSVLLALADLDRDWKPLGTRRPNPLADAVIRAKRASKWRSSYVDTFLATMDADGRIHPFINSLQARTARMSITRPALQTLPSSEWMIRRAMLADEGHVFISCDFKSIELRVLAALADVRRMKEAILGGHDLHDYTAGLLFGERFTPKNRKTSKGVGLSKVYGGGATTTARQTGIPEDEIRHAMREYDRIYPEIRRFSNREQREARANGMVTVSATGRRLPLDAHRAYAVVNYQCQSAARDVLGQSLIEMDEAGLLPYLRLPIHDEVLASAPQGEADDVAREIKRCMTMTLAGVPIDADAEIGGRSWGSLYGADY